MRASRAMYSSASKSLPSSIDTSSITSRSHRLRRRSREGGTARARVRIVSFPWHETRRRGRFGQPLRQRAGAPPAVPRPAAPHHPCEQFVRRPLPAANARESVERDPTGSAGSARHRACRQALRRPGVRRGSRPCTAAGSGERQEQAPGRGGAVRALRVREWELTVGAVMYVPPGFPPASATLRRSDLPVPADPADDCDGQPMDSPRTVSCSDE